MPISDEEAYKQGKRIAEDMARGTYSTGKDYSDRSYRNTGDSSSNSEDTGFEVVIGPLLFFAVIGLIGFAVYWFW